MYKPFEQITGLTDVAEGTIVRVITRLDEVCREVRDAARVIGDAELFKKMEESQIKIKRDSEFSLFFSDMISRLSLQKLYLLLVCTFKITSLMSSCESCTMKSCPSVCFCRSREHEQDAFALFYFVVVILCLERSWGHLPH